MRTHNAIAAVAGAMLLAGALAHAQTLSGEALVAALRKGGYVIVMRHASSPREVPKKAWINSDNVNEERQLDEQGIATATAMGKALRELKIPIGDVFTSPTYRAMQTLRYAQIANAKPVVELGDGGRGMQASTEAQAAWLERKVTQFPSGTNTLLVTHLPNVSRAFPQWSSGLEDGEALILAPDSKGGPRLVARVKIDEWPRLGW